jgi:hypothetical protein
MEPDLVESSSQSSDEDSNPQKSTRTSKGSSPPVRESFIDRTVMSLQGAITFLQSWTSQVSPDNTGGSALHSIFFRSCGKVTDNPEETEIEVRDDDQKHSLLHVFTACTADSSPLSSVQNFVNEAVRTPCPRSPRKATREEDDTRTSIAFDSQDDDESQQMHRLLSWETNGTFGTIGTHQSIISWNEIDPFVPAVDDYGNPIDPRLLEKTIESSHKRIVKRKRLVKFDYPPVSSIRECPRAAKEDLPNMFFSEKELDQFEDDRISTWVADDVEIVAVASSLSDNDQVEVVTSAPEELQIRQDRQARLGANYVPTPRRKKATAQVGFPFDEASFNEREAAGASNKSYTSASRRTPTPAHRRPSNPRTTTTTAEVVTSPAGADISPSSASNHEFKDKRLIKGVQIFLRERSLGN